MSEVSVSRMRVVLDDITQLEVDAIVNAANRSLRGGGGVDGAIHAAAGPELLEECIRLGGCPTGEARITGGYRLPARYVIHAVGPVWHGGDEGEAPLLRSAYFYSLRLAMEAGVRTIAFPCISTGVYAFPKRDACEIAVDVVGEWLRVRELPEEVVFCCYEVADFDLYRSRLRAGRS